MSCYRDLDRTLASNYTITRIGDVECSCLVRNKKIRSVECGAAVRWPLLKVFVLGDRGAGKSALARSLRRLPFDTEAEDGGRHAFALGRDGALGCADWEHVVDAMRVEFESGKLVTRGAKGADPERPAGSILATLFDVDGEDVRPRAVPEAVRRRVERDHVVALCEVDERQLGVQRRFFTARALYVAVVSLRPDEAVDGGVDAGLARCSRRWRGFLDEAGACATRMLVMTHGRGLSGKETQRRAAVCREAFGDAAAHVVATEGGDGVRSAVQAQCEAQEARRPLRWTLLGGELHQLGAANELCVLQWDEVRRIGAQCGVRGEAELREALRAISEATSLHVVEAGVALVFLRGQALAHLLGRFGQPYHALAARVRGVADHREVFRSLRDGDEMAGQVAEHLWRVFVREAAQRGAEDGAVLSAADVQVLGAADFRAVAVLSAYGVLEAVDGVADRYTMVAGRIE